jgi:hypothetical protein
VERTAAFHEHLHWLSIGGVPDDVQGADDGYAERRELRCQFFGDAAHSALT